MRRTDLGRAGEDIAATYLTARGYAIVERNVRWREGEIDLVAARDGLVAFVEVKTRRSARYGMPAEAVHRGKQRRIRALASRYLAERKPRARWIRFDVIEVARDGGGFRVRHLEGAF